VKWRARWRRLRRKIRGALNGWKQPRPLSFHVEQGADWSKHVNFTRNQSVLRIFVVVDNELIAKFPREAVAKVVAGEAAMLARDSMSGLYA
jgi:hypothetical protein